MSNIPADLESLKARVFDGKGWNKAFVEGALIHDLWAEIERLRAALAMFYDKWEDGDPCYQDPEDFTGFLGNAVKLSESEEREVLALIPMYRTPSNAHDVEAPKQRTPEVCGCPYGNCTCDDGSGVTRTSPP